MKLLITSTGGLLGQNILDSIETRRNKIEVVGTDIGIDNARVYRCDRFYKVNNTSSNSFKKEFSRIVDIEKPDLILPGRDEDCVFLAEIKNNHPKRFDQTIPFGNPEIPKMMFDKVLTHSFCVENNLPFANTFHYSNKDDSLKLNHFLEKNDFPIVIKPRKGSGSRGVFFATNRNQIEIAVRDKDVIFQEYLGDPKIVFNCSNAFEKGIPLFFQFPEETQYAAQTIIPKDGNPSEIFITINTLIFGRNEYIKQIWNNDIEDLVRNFSHILYQKGWHGPVNIQLKKDQQERWKVFELNPRLTASSSARTLLGYDEIGILSELYCPNLGFPNLTKPEKVKGYVVKYLTDNVVLDKNMENLSNDKIWRKII